MSDIPVYEIEFETGKIISLMVLTKSDWETRHRITPFYENVIKGRNSFMKAEERKDLVKYRLDKARETC